MEVNLMSDTVTKPTPAMRSFMMNAEVGDDVFGQDPTVNQLQEKAARLFGKDAALYCPSGTMTNQIAIQVHTNRLEEVICEQGSHIYLYETGGYTYNGRVTTNLISGQYGKITANQIQQHIRPVYDWFSKSALVVIENSTNTGGGNYYTLDEVKKIKKVCLTNALKLHLDGARIFNVLAETGDDPKQWGKTVDSISVCLSKGLGAPVGSLVIGSHDFIKQAKRFRKVMGGGMRQAGILAAAGIYALDHHIDRLKIDNDRAKTLGNVLDQCHYVENVRPVKTNIVIFELKPPFTSSEVLDKLTKKGIMAVPINSQAIRFVLHLDITEQMMDYTMKVLPGLM
jgi:threonine aldolase